MSTEHQQYSAAIQSAAIRLYAEQRGYEVVRTYADESRSGLSLVGRPGLVSLLNDIDRKAADFEALLVYDVSRLGRFQDPDEAASHELRCRKAGVAVHYCAEQFENDGSIASSIIKTVKRAMAGEYSRELSVKVYAGQANLIRQGFRQGGTAGLGLRRMLIDRHGVQKGILRPGEQKSIATDRAVLVLGPIEEQELVREIFDLFTVERLGETAIAKLLNDRGNTNEFGRLWSREMIRLLLINEKYIGNNVWGRRSRKLGTPHVWTAPDQWVRADGAFPPIVDRGVFDKAQAIRRARRPSNEVLLTHLRELLHKHGTLNRRIVNEDEGCPSSEMYQDRFGGMLRAYALIGFKPPKNYDYVEGRRQRRADAATAKAKAAPARFYFHLHTGAGWTRDDAGRECEADAVAGAAFRKAREVIAADVLAGAPVSLASVIAVNDSDGHEVYRVTFREVLTVQT